MMQETAQRIAGNVQTMELAILPLERDVNPKKLQLQN